MIAADVAIVGYGPVGQALAAYLGKTGLKVAVFERERYVFERARTGGVDDEAFRFLQNLGLTDEILKGTRLPGNMDFLTVDGEVMISWAAGERGRNGYARLYMWHQPDVDRIVRDYVDAFPNVDVYLEHAVEEVVQGEDSVSITAIDRDCGDVVECDASYLVGCDGARSVVRPSLNVAFESLAEDERWVVVDLTLKRDVPDLPQESHHICDPRRPVTFIRNVDNRRRWEFMVLPDEDLVEMERPEKVWELLSPWITPDDADIYRAVGYTFHSLLADRWRGGRVFLAGDAAHLMPPFLGQGLCAGFRDVRNLSWKLAAVIAGRASPDLLDTYGTERGPHVREFIELSISLGSVIQTLDPAVAEQRNQDLLAQTEKTVSMPIPQIGPGLLPATAEVPLGTLFPQPVLEDGRLLDDVSGERFTILGLPSVIGSLDESSRQHFAGLDVAVIADESAETRAALQDAGATAVLIRPDRYLLATAQSTTDLDRAVDLIPWGEQAAHA